MYKRVGTARTLPGTAKAIIGSVVFIMIGLILMGEIVLATLMESAGMLLAVVAPLVSIPLTVILFSVKSLRDQLQSGQAALSRRMEALDSAMERIKVMAIDHARDYATKEEWVRESMIARRSLDHVRGTMIRIETDLHHLSRQIVSPPALEAHTGSEPSNRASACDSKTRSNEGIH